MHNRLRNRSRIEPNPFVVLVDITLAVAFFLVIFAVTFAINNSRSLFEMTREERQVRIRNEFAGALCSALDGKTGKWNLKDRRLPILGPSGQTIAEIFENASYQRIAIYLPQFRPGSSLPEAQFREVYRRIGAVVAKNRRSFTYLELQGVAESTELADDADRKSLSRSRADAVEEILTNARVIRSSEPGNTVPTAPWMDIRFVVPFGVGSRLYADWSMNRRVDFLMFYPDKEQ